MSKLGIIVSTTRPSRIGPKIAQWVAERAASWEVEVVDVSHLPFLDEVEMPASGKYANPHTLAWAETVSGLDAVVIVTAQYNRSFPAPIKNAIDYLFAEWNGKPVALVGYGWGGAPDARDDLARILTHVKAAVVGSTGLMFNTDLSPEGSVTSDGTEVATLLADLGAHVDDATELAS